jgi:hypothetical protein
VVDVVETSSDGRGGRHDGENAALSICWRVASVKVAAVGGNGSGSIEAKAGQAYQTSMAALCAIDGARTAISSGTQHGALKYHRVTPRIAGAAHSFAALISGSGA